MSVLHVICNDEDVACCFCHHTIISVSYEIIPMRQSPMIDIIYGCQRTPGIVTWQVKLQHARCTTSILYSFYVYLRFMPNSEINQCTQLSRQKVIKMHSQNSMLYRIFYIPYTVYSRKPIRVQNFFLKTVSEAHYGRNPCLEHGKGFNQVSNTYHYCLPSMLPQ